MGHVTFEQIPTGIKVPGTYTEFDTSSGVKSIPGNPRTIVMIAQKTTADSVFPQNTIVRVFDEDQAETQAGPGSIAHLTARSIFRSVRETSLFAVYQNDDGGATDAAGTITISGTFTANINLLVWIGGTRLEFNVDSTDTFTSLAALINTKINAESSLPVTSSVIAGVVTVTAKNGGTLGNAIPISFEIVVNAGLTVAVVQLTGGATDPSLQPGLDAIFPTFLRHVYCTYNDSANLLLLKTHLKDSASPVEKKRRLGWTGIGYQTVGALNALANTINEERIEIAYLRYSKTTQQGHSLAYEIGGANIAQYASQQNPALPRNGLPLNNIIPPSLDEQLSFTEQQSLLENGVAPLGVEPGEGVVIVRTVSTKTTINGVENFTLLDMQTQDTLDNVASVAEALFKDQFQRVGITDTLFKAIRSGVLERLFLLQDLLRLRNVEENKDRIIVEEDALNTGQVNLVIPAEVVPGAIVFAEQITLIVGQLNT